MPKYEVTLYYTASLTYEVEAETEEAAAEQGLALSNAETEEDFQNKVGPLEYADVIARETGG